MLLGEDKSFLKISVDHVFTFYIDTDRNEKMGRDEEIERKRKREDDGDERGRVGTAHCVHDMIIEISVFW